MLQEENLKSLSYEKEASKYLGDITFHFKEKKKIDFANALNLSAVLEQILEITFKSQIILEGSHSFKLPERPGDSKIHAFCYQSNIYDFWKWLQATEEQELILIGPTREDQLWERTLHFLSGKGAKISHFPHQVSLIKRKHD